MNLTGVQMDEPQRYPTEAIAERARGCGNDWCHLWCEAGHEQNLHAVAAALKLRRDWFQDKPGFPHYDLTRGKHFQARRLGVPVVDLKSWLLQRRNGKGQMAESLCELRPGIGLCDECMQPKFPQRDMGYGHLVCLDCIAAEELKRQMTRGGVPTL